MEGPGFPVGPSSLTPLLVIWLLLVVVLAAAAATAVRVLRRRTDTFAGWRLLALLPVLGVVLPALLLVMPARAHVGTDTPDLEAECPLSTAAGSFLEGGPESALYRFWLPCQTASQVRTGLILGGYALVAGALGVLSLSRTDSRSTGRRTPQPVA